MPFDIRKTFALFKKYANIATILPLMFAVIGICLLTGLSIVIAQRMSELREAPGDNLTWTLSQVEVDVLVLLDEALITQSREKRDVSDVRRRFDNLFSRTTTVREAPVFAFLRENETFNQQLSRLERCLDKLAALIDQPDDIVFDNLDPIIEELLKTREDAHAIALTGIGLRSQVADAERASLGKLLLTSAIVSVAMILFLTVFLIAILRQRRRHYEVSQAIKRANQRLKSSFDVSLDAIVVANDQGIILEFNDAAETVFGFSAAEAVGANMAELIIPHHLRAAHLAGMERFNKTKEPHLVGQGRIEITALRKSGEEFPIEISIGSAEDHRGTIFISYLRDITKRLADQEDLKSARDEALAAEKAKSNFLAVMSHEMRTPLNGIFGTLELLKNSKVTKKQRGYLELAKRSGDILLHHVNDVLDISRMEAEKMELVEDNFDLEQFFQDVITTNQATAHAKSNTLKLKLGQLPDGPVLLDERRLRQITYNLISNALKFTENGTVILTADTTTDESGNSHLKFAITDTGIGIFAEDQPNVFDRFYTRESSYDRFASGAGLGLAICKQLVELMGGTISLQSEHGKGSTFMVSVPFKTGSHHHVSVSVKQDKQDNFDATPLQGKDVLLVEDNEINRLIVNEMLMSQGVNVHEAHNGRQAVEMAERQKFEAILMDVSMPVMNGIDATQLIRQSVGPNQHTRILGLTAHALEQEQERFLSAGMDDCLSKPISQGTLINALVSAVEPSERTDHSPARRAEDLIIFEDVFSELADVFSQNRLKKLIAGFELEIATLIEEIPELLTNEDMPTLAAAAHKSVGSSGMLGALAFQKKLRALEQASKASNIDLARSSFAAVQKAWPATRSALLERSD